MSESIGQDKQAKNRNQKLLTRGNSKVGDHVYLFSLPAGGDCCPGATEACKSVCYALRPHTWGAVRWQKELYPLNEEASKQSDFVNRIIAELSKGKAWAERNSKPQVCRIHDSGDFYSAEYVRKWIEIVKALPTFTFWVYTRSWRVPEMLSALVELAALPNVQLWFSCDKDSGEPPIIEGIPKAWLRITDEMPPYPVDLIFNEFDEDREPARNVNGIQVCPQENGHEEDQSLFCETCTICFRDKQTPELVQLISNNRQKKDEEPKMKSDKKPHANTPKGRSPKKKPDLDQSPPLLVRSDLFQDLPDESASEEELVTFLKDGYTRVSQFGRKTNAQHFRNGAVLTLLKAKVDARNEGWRDWIEKRGKKIGIRPDTEQAERSVYEKAKDNPGVVEQFDTFKSLKDFLGVRRPPKKLDEEQTLAELREQILAGAAEVESGEVNEAGETEESTRRKLQGIALILAKLPTKRLVQNRPDFLTDLRADLLLVRHEIDSILEVL